MNGRLMILFCVISIICLSRFDIFCQKDVRETLKDEHGNHLYGDGLFDLVAPEFSTSDELVGRRSAYSKTFERKDGGLTKIIAPFHYDDGNGWEDIDLDIVPASSNGALFECVKNHYGAYFSRLDSSRPVSLEKNGHTFGVHSNPTLQIAGISYPIENQNPEPRGNTLVYQNAFSGMDLIYTVGQSSVRHLYRVEEQGYGNPEGNMTFSETLEFDGDVFLYDEAGPVLGGRSIVGDLVVVLEDGKGREDTIVFPKPYAWDASMGMYPSSEQADSGHVFPLDATLIPIGNGRFVYSYTLDCDWICSEDREYPIYIDPTVDFHPVGNGFTVHDAFYQYPFKTDRPIQESQILIRDEYISETGDIESIGVLQTEANSYPNKEVYIDLKTTSQNSVYSPLPSTGNWSNVYYDNSDYLNGVNSWEMFNLDNNFNYSGNDNLYIAFRFNNCDSGSYNSNSAGGFIGFEAPYNCHQRQFRTTCSSNLQQYYGPEFPFIRLEFSANNTGSCLLPDNIHVDNYPSDGEIKLDWSDPAISGCGNPGYTVEYSVNGGSWQTNNTNSTLTYVNVSPGDQVQWRIRTNCCDGSASPFTPYMDYDVPASCDEPSGISSSVDANNGTVDVVWDAMSASTVEKVRVRIYHPNGTSTSDYVFTPYNTFSETGLAPGNYQFRLRTYCQDGTDSGYTPYYSFTIPNNCTPPSASFSASATTIMEGGDITFTDNSNFGTSRQWQFESGSPSVSSSSSVTVVFGSAGTRDVILVSGNNCGNHTASIKIRVLPNQSGTPNPGMANAVDFPGETDGDPVNLHSGGFVFMHSLLGLSGTGGEYPLTLTYISDMGYTGPFGRNFISGFWYDLDLSDPDRFRIRYPDGSEKHHARYEDGSAVPMYYGMTDTLYSSGNYYYLESKSGTRVRFPISGGICNRITDRYGRYVYFTIQGGKVVRINLPGGRKYYFSYTGDYITNVTDTANRSVSLTNQNGNITSITNARGKTSNYAYQNNLMTEMEDAKGNLVIRNVYQNGRVVEQEDVYGGKYYFDTPSSFPGVCTVTLPDGSIRKTYYDAKMRPYAREDAGGYRDSIVYNDWHRQTEYYDRKGELVLKNGYADGYRLEVVENAYGDSTVFQYGNYDGIESVTYPNGGTVDVILDTDGNPTDINLPTTGGLTSSFNGSGQMDSNTDLRGYATGYLYNGLGDNYRLTTPDGNIDISHTPTGGVSQITDRNGKSISFVLNEFDRIVQWTDSKQESAFFEYDDNGNIVRYTDRNGTEYTAAYDERDRLSSIAINGNVKAVYTWDMLDRRTGTRDAYGELADSLVYNNRGLVSARFNGSGWFYFAHDENGRTETITDPLSQNWTVEYDLMGRVERTLSPDGQSLGEITMEDGMLKEVGDGNGNTTAITHDEMGVPSSSTDAMAGSNAMTRNAAGDILSLTNANGETYQFAYDGRGLPETITLPGNKTYTASYGNEGEIIGYTDPNGITATLTYDANYNPASINFSTGNNYTYTHDREDRIVTASRNGGMTTFVRNEIGLPTAITGRFTNTVSYGYRDNYQTHSITYPGGLVVTYEYYPNGILKRTSDNFGNWQLRHTDAMGRYILIENSNGTSEERIYGNRGRITGYVHTKADGTVIYSDDLSYDAANNIVSNTPTNQLDPDFSSMLVGGTEMYSYGNADSQAEGPTPWTRTFDDNGNVTGETDETISNTFTFGENNICLTADFNGHSIANGYNGLQIRDERIRDGVTTRYVLDLRSSLMPYILEERDASNNLIRSYVYANGELLWMVDGTASDSYFYHFNHAGNTQALTDGSGVVAQRYGMDMFGGFQQQSTTLEQPFIFLGRYGVVEDAKGLVNIRKRYYNIRSFRFIQRDPYPWNSLNTQSINRYSYALNNPMKWVDPTGYKPEDLISTGNGVGGIRINGLNGSSVLIETYLLDFSVNLTSGKRAIDWGGDYILQGDDILSAMLDIVGVFDPTGAADAANAVLLAGKGDWLGATISGVGLVPYFGDLAKLGRIGKQVKVVRNAIKFLNSSLSAFQVAPRYGIDSYRNLRKSIGKGSGYEVHHLIEKRFAGLLGLKEKNMKSIVLTPDEHQIFTKAWRSAIPYNNQNSILTTSTATKKQVISAARRIYKDYPEILNALGL